jgi:hypothetical protein
MVRVLDYAASHGVLAIAAPATSMQLPPAIREDVDRRLLVQSMWAWHVVDAQLAILDLFARRISPSVP